MKHISSFIKILPWLVVIALLFWTFYLNPTSTSEKVVVNNEIILKEVVALGKLELVAYNFKEITEVKQLSKEYWNFFKLGPDSKIALISIGSAVGCIDLTKMNLENLNMTADTLYVNLPKSELCYYKLDLDKTRIYSLETNPMIDEKEFIQMAYKSAEAEIKKAALNANILEMTNANANLILKPMLEKISGKVIVFVNKPDAQQLQIN